MSLISNSQWFPRPHLPAEPPLDPLKDGVPRPSQLVTVQGCWEGVPGSGRVPSRPTSTLLVMFLLTTPMPGSVKAISAWLSADPALSSTSAGSPSPIPLSAGPGCQAVLLFSESGGWLWSLVPEMESWGHRRRGPRARQAKAPGTGVMGGGTGGGGPGHSGQLSQGMAARRGGGSLHF